MSIWINTEYKSHFYRTPSETFFSVLVIDTRNYMSWCPSNDISALFSSFLSWIQILKIHSTLTNLAQKSWRRTHSFLVCCHLCPSNQHPQVILQTCTLMQTHAKAQDLQAWDSDISLQRQNMYQKKIRILKEKKSTIHNFVPEFLQ